MLNGGLVTKIFRQKATVCFWAWSSPKPELWEPDNVKQLPAEKQRMETTVWTSFLHLKGQDCLAHGGAGRHGCRGHTAHRRHSFWRQSLQQYDVECLHLLQEVFQEERRQQKQSSLGSISRKVFWWCWVNQCVSLKEALLNPLTDKSALSVPFLSAKYVKKSWRILYSVMCCIKHNFTPTLSSYCASWVIFFPFFYCDKIHIIFTILTIIKCKVQWY